MFKAGQFCVWCSGAAESGRQPTKPPLKTQLTTQPLSRCYSPPGTKAPCEDQVSTLPLPFNPRHHPQPPVQTMRSVLARPAQRKLLLSSASSSVLLGLGPFSHTYTQGVVTSSLHRWSEIKTVKKETDSSGWIREKWKVLSRTILHSVQSVTVLCLYRYK